jgi:hypothetical protein
MLDFFSTFKGMLEYFYILYIKVLFYFLVGSRLSLFSLRFFCFPFLSSFFFKSKKEFIP